MRNIAKLSASSRMVLGSKTARGYLWCQQRIRKVTNAIVCVRRSLDEEPRSTITATPVLRRLQYIAAGQIVLNTHARRARRFPILET